MHFTTTLTALALVVAQAYHISAAPHNHGPSNTPATNAYSGAGGLAPGGNTHQTTSNDHSLVNGLGTLVAMSSNNGGSGGHAGTGAAGSGSRHAAAGGPGGNDFTGAGGNAAGGNSDAGDKALVELGSNNGGSGGDAASGQSGR